MSKTLIALATYNEADNIRDLISDIRGQAPRADILVIDDNSPDGTGDILEEIKAQAPNIMVIHRPGKLGLGSAHVLAMNTAIEKKYDQLVTMDADYSHHPRYLPILLELLQNHDFVIGSRYVQGGRCDYGLLRTIISKTANYAARFLLSLPLKECTTAYRGYQVSLLAEIPPSAIRSEGYSFFTEALYAVSKLTDRMAEFPIHFEDRRAGQSKISKKEILNGALTVFRLFFKRILSPFISK